MAVKGHVVALCATVAEAQQTNPPLLQRPRPAIGDTRQVYDFTVNELGDMSLALNDYSECVASIEAQYRHERPTQIAKRKAGIPPGGYLFASWNRKLASLASADKFEFTVLAANGRQICRWKSKPTMPQPLIELERVSYSQYVLVPLPESLPDFTTVIVTDLATGRKFMYLIRP